MSLPKGSKFQVFGNIKNKGLFIPCELGVHCTFEE